MRKLTRKLLEKSKESFLLALENFNKTTTGYRTEVFSILFTNTWELLLKAYLFESSGAQRLSIFRKKKRNQKRESLTIDECLKNIFPNNMDPVRKNIEFISEIRNESAHLIIDDLNPYFSRVFQRGVLNYFEYMEKWFGISLSDKFNPGLISLISDKESLKDISVLKKQFNKEDFQSVDLWVRRFKELEKLGDRATIPIVYSIAIVRNTKKADIVLSASAKKAGKKAIILERYKDMDSTHPYRRTESMAQIRKRLNKGIEFTSHDFEAYCFAKGIKKTLRNEYYWKPKYNSGQYSEKLIDEISTFLNSNPSLREKVRKQYSEHLKRRRGF